MDSEVLQYEDKIKKLLDRFLDANFYIRTDTHLNLLISHFSNQNSSELGEELLSLPIISEWLFKAVQHWEDVRLVPPVATRTFMLHLLNFLSKDEKHFVAFNSSNLYVRCCSVLQLRTQDCPLSVKLAYIKLLLSFLEHKTGIEWIIATDNWQDVLNCCLSGQTIYLVREGHSFIFNLLFKCAPSNDIFCSIVIGKIMQLNEAQFGPNASIEFQPNKVTPTLNLISYILQSCLENKFFTNKNYTITRIFLKDHNLEQSLWNVLMLDGHSSQFLADINRTIVLIFFHKLITEAREEKLQSSEIMKLVSDIFKLANLHISKDVALSLLEECYLMHYYWKLINPLLPDLNQDSSRLFENQVIIFQIIPIFVFCVAKCQLNMAQIVQDDVFRDVYITKLFKLLCEDTIRMVYNLRDSLMQDTDNLMSNARKAIHYLMKSRHLLSRDRAVIVFQCLAYVFKDIIDAMKKSAEAKQYFSTQVDFFCTHFEALATLVKDFDITWKESIETICIMNMSMEILTLSNWPQKLVTQVLKLINMSIARFMSPNLVLLVDRTSDSAMASLGSMISEKLHDMDWEVRDSALEVLHTMSNIAYSKFPSFQTMVLDCGLPTLMVIMCQNDGERYVRASAIKCLQEMIKVYAFWNKALHQENLPQKMVEILFNDTEGNVRCEAATLICKIYEHQSISKDFIEQLNEAMVRAAVKDIHWEVKLNALCYWNQVIEKQLGNQGMIDGSFPDVTFSKENRKIVTLTEAEIKNRLNKVLHELSICGCLGVLLDTMQDNSDLEVAKKAVRITQKFADLLKLHHVTGGSVCTTPISPKPMEVFNITENFTIPTNSEEVINEITKCRDITILAGLLTNGTEEAPKSNGINYKKVVNPKEFVDFVQTDLNSLIVKRQNWLNNIDNLESLLDDILRDYGSDDTNAMECY